VFLFTTILIYSIVVAGRLSYTGDTDHKIEMRRKDYRDGTEYSVTMESEEQQSRKIRRYRNEIDNINEVIVQRIAYRMQTVEKIKRVKQEADIPITDDDREEKVVAQFQTLFEKNGLDPEHGEELAELLIEIAKEEQRS
jgi:chorismate mutase